MAATEAPASPFSRPVGVPDSHRGTAARGSRATTSTALAATWPESASALGERNTIRRLGVRQLVGALAGSTPGPAWRSLPTSSSLPSAGSGRCSTRANCRGARPWCGCDVGGGGGNRTHVRKPSAAGVYADSRFILPLSRPSSLRPAGGPRDQPQSSRPSPEARFRASHQNMTPVPAPCWLDAASASGG
jgi:hypothetical protein